MQEVSGHSGKPVAATLHGHLRLCVTGEHYPAMVVRPGYQVEGMLYRHIADAAWHRLDLFEGEMYRRVKVTVVPADGQTVEAQTYLIHPAQEQHLSAKVWNFADFLAHSKPLFEREYRGYSDLTDEET